MIALIIFAILTALLVRSVKNRIQVDFRKSFLAFSVAIVFLGTFSTLVYTLDNQYHSQVDLSGDAQYYYEGALSLLQTGKTQTFYPNYEKFLAAFLYTGNPITARLAQLLLFVWIYALSIRALSWLNVYRIGLTYFSAFTVFNGIYYGTLVVFVRDFLILFSIVAMFFVLAWYYSASQRKPFLANLGLLLAFLIAYFWLRSLGHWLGYLLLIGVVGELFITAFRKTSYRRRALIAGMAVSLTLLAYLGFDEIQHYWQVNVVEARLLEAEEAYLGVERTRSILDPLKTLLGPGLIRPLFPSEYFLVWIPSHAAFYWWGTLWWYANLIVSAPLLLKKPLAFLKKRNAVFAALVFLALVGAYTLAYISGAGMRKRAMFHFFYTLLIAITYCSPLNEAKATKDFRIRVPTLLLRFAIIIMLMIATIFSVKRVL